MSFLSWSADEGFDPNPADLRPGEVVAGYELFEHLGEGGMGVVYRARSPGGRDVALKLSHVDPELKDRLRREGELMAALRHPGIVEVFAAGEDESRAWIACELIEGARGLDTLLASAPREFLLDHWQAAAEALGHAHERGVIHRDVKAENLLVDASGRLVVTDFGLGWSDRSAPLTQTGTQLGTPFAMPPEQMSGEPATSASDVWGLGVLLYQILTKGAFPFPGPTMAGLMGQVSSGKVPPPRTHGHPAPAALEAFCLRCLRLDPAGRPTDGAAAALEFQALRESCDEAPSSTSRVAPLAGGVLAVIGLLGAVAAIGLWPAPPPSPSPPPLPSLGPSPSVLEASSPKTAPEPGDPEGEGPEQRELEEAIRAHRTDAETRSSLAHVLSASLADAKPPERRLVAKAHLALAAGPARGAQEWLERLAHSRAAERSGAAISDWTPLRAEALRCLDRNREAADLWRGLAETSQRSGSVEREAAWVECANSLFLARDNQEAAAILRGRGLQSPAALRLLYQVGVSLGQVNVQNFARQQSRSNAPEGEVTRLLEVWAECARTGSLRALRDLVRSFSGSPLYRYEYARAYLSTGDYLPVLDILGDESPKRSLGADDANRLRRQLIQGVEYSRTKRLDRLDPGAREIGAICSHQDLMLQVVLVKRSREIGVYCDPKRPIGTDERSAQALLQLRDPRRLGTTSRLLWSEDAAAAELLPAKSEERWRHAKQGLALSPHSSWLLSLLLSAGVAQPAHAQEAYETLQRWRLAGNRTTLHMRLTAFRLLVEFGPLESARARFLSDLSLAKAGTERPAACKLQIEIRQRLNLDASEWIERFDWLRGSRRAESNLALARARSGPAAEFSTALEAILARDPNFPLGRLAWLKVHAATRPAESLRAAALAMDIDPRLVHALLAQVRVAVPHFRRAEFDDDLFGRLSLGLLGVALAELNQAGPETLDDARSALDHSLLKDGSAHALVRILRSFIALRQGDLRTAEHDLDVAAEHVPRVPQLLFQRALLRAARGEPLPVVIAGLRAAREAGYDTLPEVILNLERYPELRAFKDAPRLTQLATER